MKDQQNSTQLPKIMVFEANQWASSNQIVQENPECLLAAGDFKIFNKDTDIETSETRQGEVYIDQTTKSLHYPTDTPSLKQFYLKAFQSFPLPP